MKRIQIAGSSQIRSIGYDEPTRVLEIEFSSGGIYSYAEVPPITFETLMSHPSKGSFFATEIKPKYACTVIFKPEKKEKENADQSEKRKDAPPSRSAKGGKAQKA